MYRSAVLFIHIFLLTIVACNRGRSVTETAAPKIENSGTAFAQRFTLVNTAGYSILSILDPWQGAKNIKQEYYLIKKGAKIPEGTDSSKVIFVPVRQIICMSTTYLGMINELGAGDAIKGVSGSRLVYNSELRKKMEKGEVTDVGPDDNLNNEVVIKLSPDLIMVYGVGSESAGYMNKIREMGMKIIYNADYLETTPLGKAEWIKVFGALFCREKEVESIFSNIVREYNGLKTEIAEKCKVKPTVLLGLPWKDTWYISPGNSFISSLISDAGGTYIWQDQVSEISMPFGIENVFMKARNADYWLNISTVNNKSEIISVDSRLGDMNVFKRGNLYNNNRLVTPAGANDYWESGAIRPQVILKDIAAVLHPELFPGYELVYYKKVK